MLYLGGTRIAAYRGRRTEPVPYRTATLLSLSLGLCLKGICCCQPWGQRADTSAKIGYAAGTTPMVI